jgi:prophage regulatory protein
MAPSLPSSPIRLLRLPAVCDLRGCGKSKLHQDVVDRLWTAPVKLGPKFSAWPEHEVTALQAAVIAGKTPDEIRQLVAQLEAARKHLS